MTQTALDRVVTALEQGGYQPRHSGDGYTARCPAHDDRSPSLSITPSSNQVLLHCHAGCATEVVLTEIGLTMADLFDEPKPPRDRPQVVAEYRYTDEQGQALYLVRRIEPGYNGERKTFRQFRPDGTAGIKGIHRVLYRLPEVIATAQAGGTIYVVEGEKDADNLAALGVTATCNVMGAGKWVDAYTATLCGASQVVIVADRDDPGRKHAEKVAESVQRADIAARVVEAAVGKDISDHLAAGHGLDDLRDVAPADLATRVSEPPTKNSVGKPSTGDGEEGHQQNEGKTVPPRTLIMIRASQVKPVRLRWMWNGRIPLGELTLLAGREGLGKSTVAVDIVAMVTRGELDGEYAGRPRNVVYVHTEDSREHTIVPRLIAAGADMDRVIFIDVARPDDSDDRLVLPLDTPLLAELVPANDVGLIVLDAATSVLDGRLDGNRDREMRKGLEPLAKLAQDTDSSVLGIVHLGKAATADTGRAILGSIAWSQVARSVLAVARDEEEGHLVLSRTKGNLGLEPPSLTAVIVSCEIQTDDGPTDVGKVKWTGETDSHATHLLGGAEAAEERTERDEAAEWLVSYLTDKGGEVPANEVIKAAAAVGFEKRTLQRARKRAHAESRKAGFGGGWVWALIDEGAEGDTEGTEGDSTQTPVTFGTFVSPSADVPSAGSSQPAASVTVGNHHARLNPSACAVCEEPMRAYEAGQTTHPNCSATEPRRAS